MTGGRARCPFSVLLAIEEEAEVCSARPQHTRKEAAVGLGHGQLDGIQQVWMTWEMLVSSELH